MKYIVLLFISILFINTSFADDALAPANGDHPTFCEQTVALHGLLSRAQFQCGYSQYNDELTEQSRKCFQYELGEERGLEVLQFGMKEFDRNESNDGHNEICANLLDSFPEYVRE